MRLDAPFRRLTSAALALVVLVSSLTCMTVACRAVCAAEAGAGAAPAAVESPPCHRAPGGATEAPAGPAGECGSGTACCSTWLHDRDGFVLAAPALAREFVASGFLALLPAGFASPRPAPAFALRSAMDAPDPRALHLASPRASRAPPAA